jgi:hypothetical protein
VGLGSGSVVLGDDVERSGVREGVGFCVGLADLFGTSVATTATVSAAEARPTPRPARSTTTKVIAATASTTANQPATIATSGRRPIPTSFTLFLL